MWFKNIFETIVNNYSFKENYINHSLWLWFYVYYNKEDFKNNLKITILSIENWKIGCDLKYFGNNFDIFLIIFYIYNFKNIYFSRYLIFK